MCKELLVNNRYLPELFPYVDDTRPQSRQVKVAVEFGAPKHGTELNVFRNNPFRDTYYDEQQHIFKSRTEPNDVASWGLGNIWVGRIIELGDQVSEFSLGQRVAGYGHLKTTHVMDVENVLTMPEDMSWQAAVCYDPMQFALSGLRDANLRLGDRVLISGLGAIGQMAAQAARAAGASLVAVSDPVKIRRDVALHNGADLAFDPLTQDYGLLLREHTQGQGVDVVIETSANYLAVEQGLRALGYMGNMALVGWFKKASVPIHLGREGHFNQQNIFFSRACSEPNRDFPRWDFDRICRESWHLLASGKINCDSILFPIVPFAESAEAYQRYIIDRPDESIKLGVRFD